MNIVGPDALVFGVSNLHDCCKFLADYGLSPISQDARGGVFEALDGTSIVVRHEDDKELPSALPSGTTLRLQVYGVVAQEDVEEIAKELMKDREVSRLSDGSIETVDDSGFPLRFQVTQRRHIRLAGENVNSPGRQPQRGINETAVKDDMNPLPRTLSHVVLFVPDAETAARFYCERLGFKVTDSLEGAGHFLRPHANNDHHTLFFIQTPEHMKGIEHFAFHVAGPTELMIAGTRFVEAGYTSYWGPGRHKFGSNWFWYFNTPFGCHIEYDADMDKHDDNWQARSVPFGPEAAQMFLFNYREKWAPGG